MERKLILATVALSLFMLPAAIFLLQGMTAPATRATVSSPESETATTNPATADLRVFTAPGLLDPAVHDAGVPAIDESDSFDASAMLDVPIEQLILTETGPLDPADRSASSAAVRPELSGVSAGVPAEEPAVVLAELDIDALLQSEFFGGTQSDSVESKPAGTGNVTTAESTGGTKPDDSGTGSDTQPDKPGTLPDPDGTTKTVQPADKGAEPDENEVVKAEEDKEKRKRVEVTLIRPQEDIVQSMDEIIVRSRTKGMKRAFVLVRARQKDAPWWVQEEAVRQGSSYFRSRAQFGNAKTLDGTRFRMVVAFVTREEDDVPEAGVFFEEIPLAYLLSQEIDVMMKR